MGNETQTVAVTGDKKADFVFRQEALGRAQADPLPGPLLNAFAKGAIKVGDVLVRKVVAADWQIFKQTKCPLLDMLQSIAQNPNEEPKADLGEEQRNVLVFQFLNHPKLVRELAEAGELQKAANEQIGDELDAPLLNLICMAIMEQIRRSWATTIQFSAELEKDGEITFFRDAGEEKKMASAGGSTTAGVS